MVEGPSSISYNQVLETNAANGWGRNTGFMSGGIFCCPGYNVTVVLDEISRIGNNTAPLVNDMSCENSAFHAKVPICNLASPYRIPHYDRSIYPLSIITIISHNSI